METISVNVYQYHELNDNAKEKARNWYLEGQGFSFEWDNIKEDAKNIGVELNEWDYGRHIKGSLLFSAEQVIEKILKEHGECCDTWKTAKEYQNKFDILNLENEEEKEEEWEELRNDFKQAILEDYRIMCDKEYDYTQSEEYIKEAMTANEYTFLDNGQRF
jgi:hypothetical protein